MLHFFQTFAETEILIRHSCLLYLENHNPKLIYVEQNAHFGLDDIEYGKNIGLDKLISNKRIDGIIGGPPCQAYSVARRTHNKEDLKTDYKNYLFEYYLKIVERYQPYFFVFENVPGMLSAMPDGTPITDLIKRDIENKGYEIIENLREYAICDTSDYGVPQQRKRVILFGLNKNYFRQFDRQKILSDFYKSILPSYKVSKKMTVKESIGDLPGCYPLEKEIRVNGRKFSHSIPKCEISWHSSRFHSKRDYSIFKMLAQDIKSGENKYLDSNSLNEIYNKATGAESHVHKYHVLRPELPSTTILAHLYKDGLRFIHYDPEQARSITVREAARLQSFDDDFDFVGAMGQAYKMIGNAVPPKFSKVLGNSVSEFINKYNGELI